MSRLWRIWTSFIVPVIVGAVPFLSADSQTSDSSPNTVAVPVLVKPALSLSENNQTPDISPIFSEDSLPFRVRIEILEDKEGNPFLLPNGLQSYNLGLYKGKWLLLNGRTNGLHGFNNDRNNFPPSTQNTVVYVVDPVKRTVTSRDLMAPSSGLTPDQIDSLSVTSAPSYQSAHGEHALYIAGGYGFRGLINDFTTFDVLTAVDVPGLMRWVTHQKKGDTAASHIRQISDPVFQITGGAMYQLGKRRPTLLIFGQDFEGAYFTENVTQTYSEEIRRFRILDDGHHLGVEIKPPQPVIRDPNFRRRDLNVIPTVSLNADGKLVFEAVALSGVFTLKEGIWTVPVEITSKGVPSMADPLDPSTFKQGMNNYACPTVGLFSKKTGDMYTIIFGGISFGFFDNGVFQVDPELPFINQITTVKIDKNGQFSQFLMNESYPVILSTQSNPGNPLLFGAGAQFIPASGLERVKYDEDVFKLHKLKKPLLLGYIVGGIQSTLPNTNTASDSAASPYIFKVLLDPK